MSRRKKQSQAKIKYFHSSPARYAPGDVIVGKSNGWSSNVPVVFMTTSPVPHYTIIDEAVRDNWFVYQVMPTSKVKLGRMWDEYFCISVTIIKKNGTGQTMG